MPPTTLTFTSGCSLSYSAAIFLKPCSSRALHPTHTVIVSAFVPAWAELLAVAPTTAARTATTRTAAITPRLIRALLLRESRRLRIDSPALPDLVKVPNEDSTTAARASQAASKSGQSALVFLTRWISCAPHPHCSST